MKIATILKTSIHTTPFSRIYINQHQIFHINANRILKFIMIENYLLLVRCNSEYNKFIFE